MFDFKDLDAKTRSYMLQAIEEAEETKNIYYSKRFNDAGMEQWPALLKEAARRHDEHWLAFQLEARQLMQTFEGAGTPSGGYTKRYVPHTAAQTVAEGEFNRFYMLGLCRRARSEGIPYLIVYRANESEAPRPESEALIGRPIPIDEVEAQLEQVRASFESPLAQPNSGLSVRLP